MLKRDRFGIVSHSVMTDPTLSLASKAIYSILSVYANKERLCFPSVSTLADVADISQRHVARQLKELKSKGYIRREGRQLRLL